MNEVSSCSQVWYGATFHSLNRVSAEVVVGVLRGPPGAQVSLSGVKLDLGGDGCYTCAFLSAKGGIRVRGEAVINRNQRHRNSGGAWRGRRAVSNWKIRVS